jgi:tetratricopeptide (TPR) repeat protein
VNTTKHNRTAATFLTMALVLATAAGSLRAQESSGTKLTLTSPPLPDVLPITTDSDAARRAYEQGMVQREDRLFVDEGLQFFRQAVKEDPQFALGHAALAYFTVDARETRREAALATKYDLSATPDEQLLIRFYLGTKDGELVYAISAMNDLVAKYPRDKRLANLYGEWLCSIQGGFEPGEAVLKRLLAYDPHYYPATNNLAYCYALSGEPALTPPLMDQYVAALPNEPNPQDSYGEMERMLGDYQAALTHYRKALEINPNFNPSQVGLASTYALMGEQDEARDQYLVAIKGTPERPTQMNYRILRAMTYYREDDSKRGRQEMLKLAAESHAHELPLQEAEIYRTMAIFNEDFGGAMRDLDSAREVFADAHRVLPGDRDNEIAAILQTRALIAAAAGKRETAEEAVRPLAVMAKTSRSATVQKAYHSANGAELFAKGDYAAAIPELQEDSLNPLSLRLLVRAQTKAGQTTDAQKSLAALAAISDERAETAFAVPEAKAAMKTTNTGALRAGAQ